MMFATSAMGQLQYDMTPDTGPVKGGANKVVTEVFTVERKTANGSEPESPTPGAKWVSIRKKANAPTTETEN